MGLAARLKQAVHRWRGYRAALDGVSGQQVLGWAAPVSAGAAPLRVALFAGPFRLAEALAAQHRLDLARAGLGNGNAGFEMRLDSTAQALIAAAGGRVQLSLLGPAGQGAWARGPDIGAWRLGHGREPAQSRRVPGRSGLKALLASPLVRLSQLLGQPDFQPVPPPRWRQRLFAPPSDAPQPPDKARSALSEPVLRRPLADLSGQPEPADLPPLTAYGAFIRLRAATQGAAPAEPLSDLRDDLLGQSLRNGGQRVPLSAGQIAWLNQFEPGPEGDGLPPLTRAMRLLLVPSLAQAPDAGSPGWQERVLLWWLLEGARDLHLEDCLLPDRLCRWAAGGPPGGRALAALTRGLPELAGLSSETALPALLLLAIERPELLRLLPPEALSCLDPGPEGAGSKVSQLMVQLARTGELPVSLPADLSRADYARVLRHRGFDLETRQFLSLTPEGDRLAPMLLALPPAAPPPADTSGLSFSPSPALAPRPALKPGPAFSSGPAQAPGAAVPASSALAEVQLIGPIDKASGLGQAARLSGAALAHTGLRLNTVSFSPENPTPKDPDRPGGGSLRPARINLLHLNAEAVPLAFAHLPDVFSGAWNIGYVFWELDSPAPCHDLAFELLDEIWVSSAFGVSVFAPKAGIPVTNVGMCFEPLPPELTGASLAEAGTAQASRLEGAAPAAASAAGALGSAALRRAGRELLGRHVPLHPESFVFLVSFDSYSFLQRKNPLGAAQAFLRAFPPGAPGSDGLRLVLKTHNRAGAGDPAQAGIWAALDQLVAKDPRLVLLDKTLDYPAQLALLAGADAYVSLHRSEGWGFGMIEAMALGVPVLCTAYSGNLEFCSDETAFLVPWQKTAVPPEAYIFVQPGHSWAEPDLEQAARQMRLLWQDRDLRQRRRMAAKANVETNFSSEAVARRYARRLNEILQAQDRPHVDQPASGI